MKSYTTIQDYIKDRSIDPSKEIDLNTFHSLALNKEGKVVEMINIYTGEYRILTFKQKLKLLFK